MTSLIVVQCISNQWDIFLRWSKRYCCLSRRDVGYACGVQEIDIIWHMLLNYEVCRVLLFPCIESIFNYKNRTLKLRTWCSDSITSLLVISRITLHNCSLPNGWSSGKVIFGFSLLSSIFSCFIFLQVCNSFGMKTFMFVRNAECLWERLNE